MTRFFKRRWEETRGDEYDHWGFSIWYFEVDEEGYPIRQIEEYDNGKVLKYDPSNLEDEYGGLADQALELGEFETFEITQAEFIQVWEK